MSADKWAFVMSAQSVTPVVAVTTASATICVRPLSGLVPHDAGAAVGMAVAVVGDCACTAGCVGGLSPASTAIVIAMMSVIAGTIRCLKRVSRRGGGGGRGIVVLNHLDITVVIRWLHGCFNACKYILFLRWILDN